MSHRRQVLPGLLLATTTAGAQTVLPDVVVSAERAETMLRRTPVSAVVVDPRDIEARGLTQLSDLTGRVAGVAVPNGFSNQPQAVAIRGIGASQPAMSQAVGIYLDDVPLVRGYGTALWDLPDIARIEVLRGPQGTLHGQNSTAGAVKLVSLEPGFHPELWGAVMAGNLGSRGVRGYAAGRLGESPLAGSFAFSRRVNDGFGYNAVTGERVNQLDTLQWRAKLRWGQGEGPVVVLAIDGLQDRSDTSTQNFPRNHPDAAPRRSFTSAPNGDFERDALGATLTVRWQLGEGLTAKSITAWRGFADDPTLVDVGGLEIQRFGLRQRVTQRAASQEFQLRGVRGSATWTVGALAQHDNFDFHRFTQTYPLAAPAPSRTEAWSKLRTTDVGVYGQARFALDARNSVTVGLRGWRTKQEGSNAFWRLNGTGERTAQVYTAPDLATQDSGVTPRLLVESQWSPTAFVYASATQGAKFGGFNRAAESERAARVATKPEKVTTLEIGSKSRHAQGRLDLNVAAFYNRYRDLLASLNNTTIDGVLVPEPVLINAGRAHSWGLDVELAAQLGVRTSLELSMELLRSRIDEFQTALAGSVVGRRLPNAPAGSAGLTLRHQSPLSAVGVLEWTSTLRHLRSSFSDLTNTPDLKTPEQTLWDAGVTFRDSSGHWSASLMVKNLAGRDIASLRTRIPPLGVDSVYWNAPRTALVSVRWDL